MRYVKVKTKLHISVMFGVHHSNVPPTVCTKKHVRFHILTIIYTSFYRTTLRKQKNICLKKSRFLIFKMNFFDNEEMLVLKWRVKTKLACPFKQIKIKVGRGLKRQTDLKGLNLNGLILQYFIYCLLYFCVHFFRLSDEWPIFFICIYSSP